MSNRWFGVNRYWGWYPTSPEGFVVLLGMIISISSTFYLIDSRSHSVTDTVLQFLPFVFLILSFTMVVATIKGDLPKFGRKNSKKRGFSPDQPKAYVILPLMLLPLIGYYLLFDSIVSTTITFISFCLLILVYNNLKKSS